MSQRSAGRDRIAQEGIIHKIIKIFKKSYPKTLDFILCVKNCTSCQLLRTIGKGSKTSFHVSVPNYNRPNSVGLRAGLCSLSQHSHLKLHVA